MNADVRARISKTSLRIDDEGESVASIAAMTPGVPDEPHVTTPGLADARLAQLATALGGENLEWPDGGGVVFDLDRATAEASIKEGGARVAVHVMLSPATATEVEEWVASQPEPIATVLEIEEGELDEAFPCLMFERSLDFVSWGLDAVLDDIAAFAAAWAGAEGIEPAGDPRDIAPSSAWLLMGDEASYPDSDELARRTAVAQVGVFDAKWTTAKQTIVGDLYLVYFTAPRKAVHFVARAASNAFYADDIEVSTEGTVANQQQWTYLTPLIEIRPIPLATVLAANDGHLVMRGRSGKFLRPEVISALNFVALNPDDQAAVDRVVVTPAGLADLPDPAQLTLHDWHSIAGGALPLESHVSQYVVEPLLNRLLGRRFETRREYRAGRGFVDYVVLQDGAPTAAIEVKLAMATPTHGDWSRTREAQQLRRYTAELDVPGALIDANRILLFARGSASPYREIERRSASADDLEAVRVHLEQS
ncbi:hypothetical protein [Cellulomonas sp. Root137]|uniref:hypothetical protein n=1 Tax=Cellulomonas sp. Root137 TaxID=1736459 RepID=UPI0006F3DE49|nr:hypothetical protein [Cellulomonas sp. Root137]KQY41855.1 hypothetical protein ASD18_19645 [Cellulomonas sp. Root137]